MPDQATVELCRMEGLWIADAPAARFTDDEIEAVGGVRALDNLVIVEFRVRHGRNSFSVRVVLDRRDLRSDDWLPEARRRAHESLLAGAAALTAR